MIYKVLVLMRRVGIFVGSFIFGFFFIIGLFWVCGEFRKVFFSRFAVRVNSAVFKIERL